MKRISITMSDKQAEALKSYYVSELSDDPSVHTGDAEELESLEALREHVATTLENKGYHRQAEEARDPAGKIDVTEYTDRDVNPGPDLAEMLGAVVASEVDGMAVQ